MKSTDVPNGIVVRGPRGVPVLIDFDERGDVENSGTEVSIDGWDSFDDGIPDDVCVLVHSVRGNEQMLVKNLEISRIYKEGDKTSVGQIAKMGAFNNMARSLREKYIERVQMRELEADLVEIESEERT